MKVELNKNDAITIENQKWRGVGMVSGNNSSRLLVDYKWEHPEQYQKILKHIFGKEGLCVNHLKIEMGSDINSSSGTEPAIMRFEEETPDVSRGAGFILAADAKKINPEMTLDMLWWSEPKWVSSSKDVYAARYKWYRANLTAAYERYGLVFDFVSATQNERAADLNWIKYLSKSLKQDKNTPYDFSKIKVVAGEEVCTWRICDDMLNDPELMASVDVVGSHYTSWSTENTKKLQKEYGKEVWFSEGSSPMKSAKATYRFDEGKNGLSGINGVLDISARFITSYAQGSMTLYEFQPIVSSYYDGVTYCCKQLITANEPWSGNYILDSGYYMIQQFSRFFPLGWCMINSGCNGDGQPGGDGHALINSKYNYLSACNPKTGDFSVVMCNTTAEKLKYDFVLKNLKGGKLTVYETRGPDFESDNPYDKNYFRRMDEIDLSSDLVDDVLSIVVNPYSVLTISTLEISETEAYENREGEILKLPYTDDFEYKSYSKDYLKERGNAPRYTTDEGGAFEVAEDGNNHVLKQIITEETKAKEWGGTPEPVTNLGDDRWFNYSAQIDVKFQDNVPESAYTGIGVRYNLPDQGKNGWWMQLFANGKIVLNQGHKAVYEGKIELSGQKNGWNTLKIAAFNDTVQAYVNNQLLIEKTASDFGCAVPSAGRVAIYSSYHQNCFDNLKVEAVSGCETYIKRYDNTDDIFTYSEGWNHILMDSFKNFNRTVSIGNAENKCSFSFIIDGTGFNLTGLCPDKCVVQVNIDNKVTDEKFEIGKTDYREILLSKNKLSNDRHIVFISVLSGEIRIDTVEVLCK